ncbi:MAG: VOC family protein [Sulfuricaulis sp.]
MSEVIGIDHIYVTVSHFGYVLRPARSMNAHDPYSPGLHHLCLRVESETDVSESVRRLKEQNISVSEPKRYPEHAPDYLAVFLTDPDGLRLEITNYRQERRQRHDHWEDGNG